MLVLFIPLILTLKFLDEFTTFIALRQGLFEKNPFPRFLYDNFGVYGHIINFTLFMSIMLGIMYLTRYLPYTKYFQIYFGLIYAIYYLIVVIGNTIVITG